MVICAKKRDRCNSTNLPSTPKKRCGAWDTAAVVVTNDFFASFFFARKKKITRHRTESYNTVKKLTIIFSITNTFSKKNR